MYKITYIFIIEKGSCVKLHPKNKNYLLHIFYIISWNLMKMQLWDFKHIVDGRS